MTRIAAILLAAATLAGCIFHDRRSFGSVIDDQNLELSIIDSINRDKELALKNHVEVVVYNGVVLLIGRTSTAELSARAEQVAMGYQGVRRVVNEIEVGPRIDVGDTTSDKVLSTRVKTGLADIVGIKGFDPTRVNVTTEARRGVPDGPGHAGRGRARGRDRALHARRAARGPGVRVHRLARAP